MKKRAFQALVAAVILVTSFASAGGASAGSRCASNFTVQWGDTLSGIAIFCGTSVAAIQVANPGLGTWVYAGQTIHIPNGSVPVPPPQNTGTYRVRWGDTIGKIAARTGTSVWAILNANPQIWNPDLIYVGQVINLPAGASPRPYPTPAPTQPPALPPVVNSYSTLTVAYKPGLFIRATPGGTIIASALNKSVWRYKQSSLLIDASGKVWAEVRLIPAVKGYTTGWLLVKDQLGKYFTDPPIDPPLDP
jgi:LysM repeat protein